MSPVEWRTTLAMQSVPAQFLDYIGHDLRLA
jgi:hypothetical protein